MNVAATLNCCSCSKGARHIVGHGCLGNRFEEGLFIPRNGPRKTPTVYSQKCLVLVGDREAGGEGMALLRARVLNLAFGANEG